MIHERKYISLEMDWVRQAVVSEQISLDSLPFYEQAAGETGFGLSVIAREGQPYTFQAHVYGADGAITNETRPESIIIDSGRVAIAITRNSPTGDHSPFWRRLDELKAASKPQ